MAELQDIVTRPKRRTSPDNGYLKKKQDISVRGKRESARVLIYGVLNWVLLKLL